MRILWTLPYLPWPITSGGKARQYHLIREMARRGHAITLLVQSKTPADAAVQAALAPWVERLVVLPRRGLRHPLTLWHAAVSRLPLLTSINGHAPALSQAFEALLAQPWDVVQIEHSYGLHPYLEVLQRRRQPFVLTEHNIESSLGAATYGRWPAWMQPLARHDQARARRWEHEVLPQAAAVVAVTPQDAEGLARLAARPVAVVCNGVDVAAFAGVQPDVSSRTLLFVGNYDYAPNIDAVEWLVGQIMPALWRQQPEARLRVCGHAMPAAWRERHPDPRLSWGGYVDDLTAEQARSAVFVAPLRSGGGSKLKVLEALAAGLPVVSTREGVSGLALRAGEHAHVADHTEDMAQALAQLLADPQAARQMGEAGRQWVARHHDWAAAAEQLEAVYLGLSAGVKQAVSAAPGMAPVAAAGAGQPPGAAGGQGACV